MAVNLQNLILLPPLISNRLARRIVFSGPVLCKAMATDGNIHSGLWKIYYDYDRSTLMSRYMCSLAASV